MLHNRYKGWLPVDEIIKYAERVKSDINAIGTHNHCRILSHKLGSTAKVLLFDSPFDVLDCKRCVEENRDESMVLDI